MSQKKNFALPIYWKNDSHWSPLGGFIGYREIATYLNKHFGYSKPLEWNDVKIWSKPRLEGDLTSMLGLGAELPEMAAKVSYKQHWVFSKDSAESGNDTVKQHYAPFATEVNDSSLPRAYFMRDSFTSNMQPFLSEHFSRAFYHWNFLRKKDDDFLPDEVLREHPDIVIQQVAECLLARDVFPNPPEVEASVMASKNSSAAKNK